MKQAILKVEPVAVFVAQLIAAIRRDQHCKLAANGVRLRICRVNEIAVPDAFEIFEELDEHRSDGFAPFMHRVAGDFSQNRIRREAVQHLIHILVVDPVEVSLGHDVDVKGIGKWRLTGGPLAPFAHQYHPFRISSCFGTSGAGKAVLECVRPSSICVSSIL